MLKVVQFEAQPVALPPRSRECQCRLTLCSSATDLSAHRGGMIAPMLGGVLLGINQSVPVYASVIVFAVAGFCVLLIREQPREQSGGRVFVH